MYINNEANQQLSVILSEPKNISKDKMPAVIILHGFKGYKEEKHLESIAEMLAQNGILSIRFDARGSGDSEGDFYNDYRFSNYFSDLKSVHEHVKNIENVDENRIGLCGHSLGAYLALFYGAETTVKSICSISPPDTIGEKDLIAQLLPKWREDGFIELDSSKFGKVKLPIEFYDDVSQYNLVEAADKLNENDLPINIIAGDADDIVPLELSKKVSDMLTNSKFSIFNGVDHAYKHNPEKTEEVSRHVVDFFKNTL